MAEQKNGWETARRAARTALVVAVVVMLYLMFYSVWAYDEFSGTGFPWYAGIQMILFYGGVPLAVLFALYFLFRWRAKKREGKSR